MTSPEQSLTITDLVYIIIRSWRRIILFAIIGALLLGGFAVYRNRRTVTDNSPEVEITLTDKEIEAVTKDVLASNLEVIRNNKQIDALNTRVIKLIDRIDNSVYLMIDEHAQPISSFEVAVVPEGPSEESEDTLEQRRYFLGLDYLRHSKSNDFYNYLALANDGQIDASRLQELVECKLITDNTLHVELTAPDRDAVTVLSQAAQEFFLHEIRVTLGVNYLYEAEILNIQSRTVENPDIGIERNELQEELDQSIISISDKKAEIDLMINDALDEKKFDIQQEQSSEIPTPSVISSVVKFMILGLFIGVLAASFWAIYQAMSSGVIRYPDEFAEQLSLLYVGSIAAPKETSSKSFESGIDHWLERRFWGRRKGQITGHMDVQYVASIISGLDREAGLCVPGDATLKTSFAVAVIGDDGESAGRQLAGALNEATGKTASGTECKLVGVLANLNTAEGVKALQSSDAAIVLVRPRETKIRKAMRDLDIAVGMGKQVLGIVSEERSL